MIDPSKLDDVYSAHNPEADQGPGDPVKPTPRKGPSAGALDTLYQDVSRTSTPISSGQAHGVEVGSYIDYMPEGVYTNRPIDLIRGQNQSVMEKLGIRAASLVPNMVAGLIDIAGYTGSLVSEWGDNRDYDNAFTQAAEALRQGTRDVIGETYARTDQQTLGSTLADPTWWIDNAFQLVEFAAPMAIGGAGAGSFMNALTRGAAEALQLGATGTRIAGATGQALSAGFVAYSEAAQSGNQVFKDVYSNQFTKLLADGEDPEVARDKATHLAAQSAASTVQLATALSTMLNLHAVAPYFKRAEDTAADILGKEMTPVPGEGTSAWASRIKALNPANYPLIRSEGIGNKLIAAGLEGAEEVVQNVAQTTGTEMGKEGKTAGLLEQFSQIQNYLDRVSGKDNILSFGLGALGGGLIEYISQNVIPSKLVNKVSTDGTPLQQVKDGELQFDAQGNPVYQKALVTPRTADKWYAQQSFTNMRDALAQDISNFGDLQTEYLDAVKNGKQVEADKLRTEMFNTAQLYAVKTGMTEPWKSTFQNIADLSQEEAIQRGYAADEKDDAYKKKATEAISDLNSYSREYEKLLDKFGAQYESNTGAKQVVDMMFARKVDLMSWKRVLDEHEQKLQEKEREAEELANMKDPGTYNELVSQLQKQYQSAQVVRERFQIDLKALEKAANTGDEKILARLIKKYRAVGVNDNDTAGAIRDLTRKIDTHLKRINDNLVAAQDGLMNSTYFDQWKSFSRPNGTFEEYLTEVRRRYEMNEENALYRADLEDSRRQYEIASQNYADIADERNAGRFIRKAENWQKQLLEQTQEAERQQTLELARRAKDKATLNKLEKMAVNEMAERYKGLAEENTRRMEMTSTRIAGLQQRYAAVSMFRDPIKKLGLAEELKNARNELAEQQARARRLETLYLEHVVDTSTPDQDLNIETITQQDADVEDLPSVVDTQIPQDINTTTEQIYQLTNTGDKVILDEVIGDSVADSGNIEWDLDTLFNELETISPKPEIIENNNATYEVVKQLNEMMYHMPHRLIDRLQSIEYDLRNGNISFSYDLLKPEMMAGMISSGDAARVLQLLNDVIRVTTEDELVAQGLQIPPTPTVTAVVDTEGPGTPDTPPINNTDEETATVFAPEETGARHAGYKITDVMSVANMTLNYTEAFDEKTQTYRKLNLPNEINPNINPDVLLGNKLLPGTAVRFEVDTEYDGDANINNDLVLDDEGYRQTIRESFADYADNNGKVLLSDKHVGNVPIKIVDANTGRKVGYMRKLDWVQARYPGTTDYRNVQHITYDQDGNPVDNMALQVAELMKQRRAIVEQFNNGSRPTDGSINFKGGGRPILNYKTNLNTGNSKVELGFARSSKSENSLLPDTTLELAVIQNGTAHTSYNYPFKKPTSYKSVDLVDGSVVAMIPAANGKFTYAPLIGQRLADGKRKTAVQTVARVIELYLLNDGINEQVLKEIRSLEQRTGFDIATEAGLKNFINQYFTYTQSFKQTDTAANAPAKGAKAEQFLFNIWDKVGNQSKGNIRVGWAYSGRPVISAVIQDGRLAPAFIQALEEGFSTRSRAVVYTNQERNLKGINSSGGFTDVIYTAKGEWRFTDYPSYNEYVKSFSKTAVYGRNQLPNGKYVYTANPQIGIEVRPLNSFPVFTVKSNEDTKVVKPEKSTAKFDDTATGLLDDISLFSIAPSARYTQANELATAPEQATPMTVQTLTEMYNFTPESQRNGKTVQEVYEQLTKTGHTFLPEGFNPFSRCL